MIQESYLKIQLFCMPIHPSCLISRKEQALFNAQNHNRLLSTLVSLLDATIDISCSLFVCKLVRKVQL